MSVGGAVSISRGEAVSGAGRSCAIEERSTTEPPWPDCPSELVRAVQMAESAYGIYVHIPFCSRRCGYCDFAAFHGLDHLAGAYVEALLAELEDVRDEISVATQEAGAATLYFGGGTPSRLPLPLLETIVAKLSEFGPREVSLEANPEDVDKSSVRAWAGMGITRVSLGVQSFDRRVLAFLERSHDPFAVAVAVDLLRSAGIDDVNLDLIYGSPVEDLRSWEQTLSKALGLEPTHLSCYALTIERGSRLGSQVSLGTKQAPTEDDQASKLEIARDVLEASGFHRYEVSVWAKPGRYCVHNLVYWSMAPYRGLGCAAHSFTGKVGGKRSWNVRHPSSYTSAAKRAMKEGRSVRQAVAEGSEQVDAPTWTFDCLSLGLRRSVGVELSRVVPVGMVPPHMPRLKALASAGFVEILDGWVRATPRGMAVLNEIVCAAASDLERAAS